MAGIAGIGGVMNAMGLTQAGATNAASTGGIGATGAEGAAGTGRAQGAAPADGNAFTDMLNNVQATQDSADSLAVQAATGTLTDVHNYTIAATEAQLTTDLTVAVRDKAVEAFNEIMRMPV